MRHSHRIAPSLRALTTALSLFVLGVSALPSRARAQEPTPALTIDVFRARKRELTLEKKSLLALDDQTAPLRAPFTLTLIGAGGVALAGVGSALVVIVRGFAAAAWADDEDNQGIYPDSVARGAIGLASVGAGVTLVGATWLTVRRRQRVHRHEVGRIDDELEALQRAQRQWRREQLEIAPTGMIDRRGGFVGVRVVF